MGLSIYQWWSWTGIPLWKMGVCLKGNFPCKKFKWYNFHGNSIVRILVYPVSIRLKLFTCITWMDVLNEVSIYDGADGGSYVQYDPICIDGVSFWRIVCRCHHGESHLQWLWTHTRFKRWLWAVYRIFFHFLASVSREIRKSSPIFSWDCLDASFRVTLDERHCPGWCMCLALWSRIFLTAQYVIGGGWVFG